MKEGARESTLFLVFMMIIVMMNNQNHRMLMGF